MLARLAGEHIGSIRQIRFITRAPDRRPPADARSQGDERPAGDPAPSIIELETKSGRYLHLLIDRFRAVVMIRTGAATPPRAGGSERTWQDLTEQLPTAFDGRPQIAAVTPIGAQHPDASEPSAAGWLLTLTTGCVLRVDYADTGPSITQQ